MRIFVNEFRTKSGRFSPIRASKQILIDGVARKSLSTYRRQIALLTIAVSSKQEQANYYNPMALGFGVF